VRAVPVAILLITLFPLFKNPTVSYIEIDHSTSHWVHVSKLQELPLLVRGDFGQVLSPMLDFWVVTFFLGFFKVEAALLCSYNRL